MEVRLAERRIRTVRLIRVPLTGGIFLKDVSIFGNPIR